MSKSTIPLSLLIFLFLNVAHLTAQKTFHVTIQIAPPLEGKNISVTYDNGLISKNVKDSFMAGKLNISDKFYAPFAVLKITYSDSSVSYNDEYFIGVKPALISFSSKADFVADGHFKHSKLSNAIEITQSDMSKKRIEFEKDESNDMNQFVERHKGSIWKSDSLKTVFNEKWNKINEKNMDFVKLYGTGYYSFWLFKTQILIKTFSDENADRNDFKQLLNLFIRSFPVAFKESGEGKNIQQLLKDRIDLQKDRAAPNFKIKDIDGNTIRLNDFKGKFVLLDFWATWCGPCMKELPFIKKIRADFPPDKLAIIGISSDVDYKQFSTIVKEKEMDWIQVFGDQRVSEIFGVSAIPRTFLIDKNGIIIFDGKKEGNDELIKLLRAM